MGRHAPEYANNPDAEIVACCDEVRERAERLRERFGGKAYDSHRELLADASVDAVSVCAANAAHAPLAIAALDLGKHVLCEKPMGLTMDECRAMVAAAARSGKKLMIGHNQRFDPAHLMARKLIASGEMGKVLSFAAVFGHGGPEKWAADKGADTWFFRKSAAGVGAVADLGLHKIDLLRFLIGDEVASAYARLGALDKRYRDGRRIDVDDNAHCLLEFERGTTGTVTASWTHYGKADNSVVLYCENGVVTIAAEPVDTVEVAYRDGRHTARHEFGPPGKASGVIDAFVECVVNDTPPPVSGADVLGTMEAVFACVKASETGVAVRPGSF